MKVKYLMNLDVQVFNNLSVKTHSSVMKTHEVLLFGQRYRGFIDKAREYSGKETKEIEHTYKEMKSRMFCWLPSAICNGDKSNIVHTFPVLCLDIDKQDNEGMDIETVKDKLIELPFIYYVGLSFGGRGVFALAFIEDAFYYSEHFHALEDYIYDNLGLVIDSQCGNANRLRFISYDDNPRMKDMEDDVKPFKELKWNNKQFIDETLQLDLFNNNKKKDLPDLLDDDKFCWAVIDYCIDKLYYHSGSRTNGWIQDLSACKSLGIAGEDLALRISRQSAGYVSDADVLKVLNHKHTYSRRENITKFFKLCKEHFNNQNRNWIFAIKELYEL